MKNLELIKKVEELNKASYSDADISRELNISQSKARSIRVSLGLPTRNRTYISDDEVREGVQAGLGYTAIAKKYNTSESQVRRRVEKLHLTVKDETKEFDEQIKAFIDQGLNIKEISEKLGVKRRDRIWDSIKRLGLFDEFFEKNKKYTHIRNINFEEFKQKHQEKFTDTELSEYFNISLATVKTYRKKLKLPINIQHRILNIKNFTEDEFQVLYGTILGDANLDHRSTNVCGSMAHCVRQKEFIEFKHQMLQRFTSDIREKKSVDYRFKNPEYYSYYMYIKSSKALNDLYPKVYKNKVKYIDKELLYKLTGLGIATWYMDDGSNGHYGYILCTNSFSKEDLQLIQNFFKEKYDINTTIRKDNTIYIKADSKQKFKNLVSPYIIESMKYKL